MTELHLLHHNCYKIWLCYCNHLRLCVDCEHLPENRSRIYSTGKVVLLFHVCTDKVQYYCSPFVHI